LLIMAAFGSFMQDLLFVSAAEAELMQKSGD
jgi:hypothetical protein